MEGLSRGGQSTSHFKPHMDRTKLKPSRQLGAFECPGSCRRLYKTQECLQAHIRISTRKNEMGELGQNKCVQPGYEEMYY